jgi:hypothetical protein
MDAQYSIKDQAGPDGIPGRGCIADISDYGGPGAKLVAGNRSAGLCQKRILRLNIGRGSHLIHAYSRADGQARLGIESKLARAVQVFYVNKKFRGEKSIPHADKYVGAPKERTRRIRMKGQKLAGFGQTCRPDIFKFRERRMSVQCHGNHLTGFLFSIPVDIINLQKFEKRNYDCQPTQQIGSHAKITG